MTHWQLQTDFAYSYFYMYMPPPMGRVLRGGWSPV